MQPWVRWTDSFRSSASAVGAILLLMVVAVFCLFVACLAVFMPEMED